MMGWLVGVVVLILLVFSAGFRKFAGALVLVGALLGGFFYFKSEREEARSLSRISSSELVLDDVKLEPDYSGYKLLGRITNRSEKYTLKQVSLVVTMRDCNGESKNCVTIEQSDETMYLNVPPGQARDFDESVYFSGADLNPKGHLEWDYSIVQIKGE